MRFIATVEQSKYIITKPLHHSQRLVLRNPDGTCIFEISVVLNFEFYSVGSGFAHQPAVRCPETPTIRYALSKDKVRDMGTKRDRRDSMSFRHELGDDGGRPPIFGTSPKRTIKKIAGEKRKSTISIINKKMENLEDISRSDI